MKALAIGLMECVVIMAVSALSLLWLARRR